MNEALAESIRRLRAEVMARARTHHSAGSVALRIGQRVCGSMDPAAADALEGLGFERGADYLRLPDADRDHAARSRRLEQAARRLCQAGIASAWRDERIDVRADGEGDALACIDRCAVRALGITTQSVRLNGRTAAGELVVALRAPHKRVDPGLWDNLAGGLVAAGESLREAMLRETFEEAGLDLAQLPLLPGGSVRVWRRLADGLLSEIVHVFDVDLPPGTAPVNRDGEVERFETWDLPRVLEAIAARRLTVEASLATLDHLERRA